MRNPASALRYLQRRVNRWVQTPRRLRELGAIDHPRAPLLARAITRTTGGEFTPAERERMDRIEAFRRTMNRSSRELRIHDLSAADRLDRVVAHTTVGAVSSAGSKSPEWCRLLFALVREFQPAAGLELGTCMGLSAAYQGTALLLNGAGRLTTIEGQPEYDEPIRSHLRELEVGVVEPVNGRFEDVLPDVIERIDRLDYAFIDGHHAEQPTLDYFDRIAPKLNPGALVIFDDIDWSDGMRRAWRKLAADPRLALVVDLYKIGLGVYEPGAAARHVLKIAVR